ncbi:MAG: hypothetical protein II954_04185 [Synergistaceae bacterium]|nr:hypothetical protein [Synergistaceae bacterium]
MIAINDLKERIDDMKPSQSQSITRWAILIAVLICAVQVCLTLYLR